MVLPLPQIIQVAQLMARAYASGIQQGSAGKRHELDTELERHRASLQAHIRELEIAAQNERVSAQKEILLRLIESAQHVFDKKMDFFEKTFAASQSLVAAHQHSLMEEKRQLLDTIRTTQDRMQALMLQPRLTEVANELLEIDRVSFTLTQEFNQRVEAIQLELGAQPLRLA